MPQLIPVLTEEDIRTKVAAVAKTISEDYSGRQLILVGVLKGAFIFLSDLARHLTIPVQIDFLRASSYGTGTSSSEKIQITKKIDIDIKNKDVIVVEDIIDTGLTAKHIVDYVESLNPKSVKVCTLLDKRERRKCDFEPDYRCHVIEKGFLVGYGLDYAEDYRELKDVCQLKL